MFVNLNKVIFFKSKLFCFFYEIKIAFEKAIKINICVVNEETKKIY